MRRFLIITVAISAIAATCASLTVVGSQTALAATSETTIVVGGDGDLAISPGVAQGFEAGIYRFNKAGGLAGRKIKFLGFLDDGFSAQTNLTNAQKLVENQHAMFVAPFLSEIASASTGQYLAAAKVPFIGWNVNGAFGGAPKWGFGINGNQENPNVVGATGQQLLVAAGFPGHPEKAKIAFIAENVAGGVTSNAALASATRYEGAHVVYQKAAIPVIGTTDYAPYAQAIIGSGANVAFETLDSADAIGLAAALKAAGFKGAVVNGVTYFPGQLEGQPNEIAALNGVYVANEFPADENKTPAVQQAKKDLIAVGQKPNLVSGVSIGYWSAIVLEQMLRATLKDVGGNPSKISGAALQKTVNSGSFSYQDPIPGGIGAEYFPAAEKIPTGCGTMLKTVGTTYKQIVAYQCLGAINSVAKKKVDEKTGKLVPN